MKCPNRHDHNNANYLFMVFAFFEEKMIKTNNLQIKLEVRTGLKKIFLHVLFQSINYLI